MEKLSPLVHYHTATEIADLCEQCPRTVKKLVRCKIHPPYVWKARWKEPRWHPDMIPQWLHIFATVDLDSLPENPPPLERPAVVFKASSDEPTEDELAIAQKLCGIK